MTDHLSQALNAVRAAREQLDSMSGADREVLAACLINALLDIIPHLPADPLPLLRQDLIWAADRIKTRMRQTKEHMSPEFEAEVIPPKTN